MGKPLITTDTAGCRDAVDDGVTGLLCRPKDAGDLARKMKEMLALPASSRNSMGQAGREKMIRGFDEQIVIARYIHAIEEILGKGVSS